jgi:hypothetical protein
MDTISRSEAARRLGYKHTGESDAQLTARLRAIGDPSIVQSRGNPPRYGGKRVMPLWSPDGVCVEEGDDPKDGRLGEIIEEE